MSENNVNTALTAEQENMVRKYINSNLFDVEAIIEYLNAHETIGFEIFNHCRAKGEVEFTFLKHYRPIKRDEFIRRIVIYFFDLNNKGCIPSVFDLFEDYARSKLFKNSHDSKTDIFPDKYEIFNYEGLDLEEVYRLLVKVIYDYKIPLEKVMKYLGDSFGNYPRPYEMFYQWTILLSLLKTHDDEDVFPKNFYFALNTELEKQRMNPKIVPADARHRTWVSYRADEKRLVLTVHGFFPLNERGELVKEWAGIWLENAQVISVTQLVSDDENYSLFPWEYKGSNMVAVEIAVTPDTRVFELKSESDENGQLRNKWVQVCSGPGVSEFSLEPIIKKREELKLTQKDVASLANIALRSYQRYEKGESTPNALEFIELMNILGLAGTYKFIKKYEIIDDDFSKFKSGECPSKFLKSGKPIGNGEDGII